MSSKRFELALERLRPADWKMFEELASKFLASDFPALRTVSAASGDRGRDAFLFGPGDDESVVVQYSVQADWATKIRDTGKRVRSELPKATILIYVTNQIIGAKADDLRKKIRRDFNLYLDIRDRSWFLERATADRPREIAAEELAEQIVDQLLASREVVSSKAMALSSLEAQAALVHLGLQWEDDSREKGLTKLCFEALVRAALRGTTPEKRLHRDAIKEQIRKLLPTHPPEVVDAFTDSTLKRLTKKAIRHYPSEDEFCLAHDERLRLSERLAELEETDRAFLVELEEIVRRRAEAAGVPLPADVAALIERVRRVLEQFLLSRGEQFAAAVRSGQFRAMAFEALRDLVVADMAARPDDIKLGPAIVPLVDGSVEEALAAPSPQTQGYLRSLADSYTLFAFLRETPDVQSAISKIFSHGDIWMDAMIVLPLVAEELLDQPERRFWHVIQAARESGLELRITAGVLEEVERHINRCLTCWRGTAKDWEGNIPFLFSAFASSGRPLGDFGKWLEQFCGTAHPADDITDYLEETFGIQVASLQKEATEASTELRGAVQEIWHEAHERRRKGGGAWEIDPLTTARLVAHDVENYLGVIGRRSVQRSSALGYTTWWLTLDRTAFEVPEELKKRMKEKPADSPVLSIDFLVNYLALGPVRVSVSKQTESQLPIVPYARMVDLLPAELLDVANQIREESQGLPERVVRRRVRDALDAAKTRRGPISKGGIGEMHRDLTDRISKGTES